MTAPQLTVRNNNMAHVLYQQTRTPCAHAGTAAATLQAQRLHHGHVRNTANAVPVMAWAPQQHSICSSQVSPLHSCLQCALPALCLQERREASPTAKALVLDQQQLSSRQLPAHVPSAIESPSSQLHARQKSQPTSPQTKLLHHQQQQQQQLRPWISRLVLAAPRCSSACTAQHT